LPKLQTSNTLLHKLWTWKNFNVLTRLFKQNLSAHGKIPFLNIV
jgi:hypothetical protein